MSSARTLPLRDPRLVAIAALLPVGFVGHTIQLLSEDRPWDPAQWPRYDWTPGWHLALPPWLVVAFAVGLGVAVLGLAVAVFRRGDPHPARLSDRTWLLATATFYFLHYLTYPFRIRNHMTLMFAMLFVIAGCHVVAGRRSRTEEPRTRVLDRWIVRGVALVLALTYTFAALHKTNVRFLDLTLPTAALRAVDDFWIYGDLGHAAPPWAKAVAIYGTLVVEYSFVWLAWAFTRTRVFFVVGLMLFHFPHIAVMNVADYPMIASAFFPALFSEAHWRVLQRQLPPSLWTTTGAAVGVGAQLWWMPYWGAMMVYAFVVVALWGAWIGAMAASFYMRFRPSAPAPATGVTPV